MLLGLHRIDCKLFTFPPADVVIAFALSVSPGFGNLSTCSIMSAFTDPTTTSGFWLASAAVMLVGFRVREPWRRDGTRKAEH